MNYSENGFDWDKNKNYQIKKRGNLSLLATSTIKEGNLVGSKARCVWPSSLSDSENKIFSRRVWGKQS